MTQRPARIPSRFVAGGGAGAVDQRVAERSDPVGLQAGVREGDPVRHCAAAARRAARRVPTTPPRWATCRRATGAAAFRKARVSSSSTQSDSASATTRARRSVRFALLGRQAGAPLERRARDDAIDQARGRRALGQGADGDQLQRALGQAILDELLEVAPRPHGPLQDSPSSEHVCDPFDGSHTVWYQFNTIDGSADASTTKLARDLAA